MSEGNFGTGEERTLAFGPLAPFPEDVVLYACIDDAITRRTGEGASEEQRLAAVAALLGADEEFSELVDRLRTLIDAGKAKELERFVAQATADGEAEG